MLINRNQYKELIRNPLFIFGGIIVLMSLLVSIGGAMIRPDSSPHANSQLLQLSTLKPGEEVFFLRIKENIESDYSFPSSWFIGWNDGYKEIPISKHELLKEQSIMAFQRVGSDMWEEIDLKANECTLVTKTFYLGTDRYGRDLLSRLMAGTYISLSVGIISVFISLLLGITLGLIAGYYRGWVDRIIVWFINVIWSIPTLLLVIAITLVLGKGFWQIFVAVGLTMWVEVARVVRGQVMSVREKEYVQAGIVLGFSDYRIITRHILPNVLSPVIVISAANFATAILLEAGLSFLGIGAPPPIATWGKMISEHKAYLITGDAHLAIIPGIAIMLLVLSFTFIGNALRDALDERRLERA